MGGNLKSQSFFNTGIFQRAGKCKLPTMGGVLYGFLGLNTRDLRTGQHAKSKAFQAQLSEFPVHAFGVGKE